VYEGDDHADDEDGLGHEETLEGPVCRDEHKGNRPVTMRDWPSARDYSLWVQSEEEAQQNPIPDDQIIDDDALACFTALNQAANPFKPAAAATLKRYKDILLEQPDARLQSMQQLTNAELCGLFAVWCTAGVGTSPISRPLGQTSAELYLLHGAQVRHALDSDFSQKGL